MTFRHIAALGIMIAFTLKTVKGNDQDLDTDSTSNPFSFSYTKLTLAQQLDSLGCTVPLSYNAYVKSYIDSYSAARYRNHLSKMAGLAEYYFPIYEKVFKESGVPEEIKYLSIVESALNPHAVSRVGATGPWQFMFTTAKAYNLQIDQYVDERKDPYAASFAAAAYLKDAYNEFGDWHLAIASYNCGKGNVIRAIKRSGLENPDFWQIRNLLPAETRNYVPAFIALTYVMRNSQAFQIESFPNELILSTDIVSIDRTISLADLAASMNISLESLKALNPAYKKQIVNGSQLQPKRLIIPAVEETDYAKLYAVLNGHGEARESSLKITSASEKTGSSTTQYHRVQRGESLSSISKKYGIEIQDIKAWNNLRKSSILPGQRLAVSGETISRKQSGAAKTYVSYKVRRGDSLSSIAKRYKGVTVSDLKAENSLRGNQIKAGMTLQIRQQL